jgi:hypothetical protein
MPRLLRSFAETGIGSHKIERFLDFEQHRGYGTVRDQMAADMSNQLLGALGRGQRQSREEVRRLRGRGAWRTYDRPPEEGFDFTSRTGASSMTGGDEDECSSDS